MAQRLGWQEADQDRWSALGEGSLRLLDAAAFQRAEAQLEAWLALLGGSPFGDVAGPLLPEKEATLAQGEQLRQPLELLLRICLLYTSPSPRDRQKSRMPSSA